MAYYKNKKRLIKKIGYIVAGVSVLALATIGISKGVSYIKNDTKDLKLSYEVGSLTSDGKYQEDKSKIYTKEKFACDGLKATLDFDSTINYQLFYYDILDNFISSSEVLINGYNGLAPFNGAYARVIITPLNDEDNKISFTEIYKYGNQLNISVNKNSNDNVKNKYVSYKGKVFTVVNNLEDTKFTYGYKFVDDLTTEANGLFSSTTQTILYIEKDCNLSFSDTSSGYTLDVFVFNELPNDNVSYSRINLSSILNIDLKKGNFILISIWNNDSSFLKTNNDIFNSYFSFK